MLQAGAAGYLTRHSAVGELAKAIREVSAGGPCLSQSIIPTAQQLKAPTAAARPALKVKPLTEIERRVIGLLSEGLSNKDLVSIMNIECSRVKYYRERAMSKLNLHSVAELTRYAIAKGLTACGSGVSIKIPHRMSTSGLSNFGFASNRFDPPTTAHRHMEPKRDDLAEVKLGIVAEFCSTERQHSNGLQGHTMEPESTNHSTEITQRESEVLRGIANGLTNKAIAARLRIGIRTVETHREKVMRKLGIRSIAGLTKFVLANEEVPLSDESLM
jgi:DNA-binding NarL/FixJ family response regulator